MNYVQSAGVIVYRIHNAQREYLVLRSAKGHWDFAKGKQEKDETLMQTAIRELHEETGLTATVLDVPLPSIRWIFTEHGVTYTKTGTFFIGYAITESSVQLSPEHIDYRWLPYTQAYDTLTHATSRSLLEQAEKMMNQKHTQGEKHGKK